MGKRKAVNYTLIAETESKPWTILCKMRQHHHRLQGARFALAWQAALKEDPDGKLVLGRCKKASDLDKELAAYDFVIILNEEAWGDLSDAQREALVDHELCHAAVALDKHGEPKIDVRGRKVYRIRKHDIEEFTEIVNRHGTYKKDLEAFAEECAASRKTPLFGGTVPIESARKAAAR